MMEAELAVLKKGLGDVDKEIVQLPEGSNDPFREKMSTFYESAMHEYEKLAASLASIKDKFKVLLELYGEDSNTELETFLGSLYNFVSTFERAKKENQKRKETQEKAIRAEKKKMQTLRRPTQQDIEQDAKGAMDKLVDSLHTGQAFKNKRASISVGGQGRTSIHNLMNNTEALQALAAKQKEINAKS
eukprot:TRINITY_DN15699_c0_g1_i2.p1 TRINITY_DN15699_c0_g1~~TRINITY_DN15699_c0_g1_i2.p1  ORF type:complete len:217 (-),score=63.02 TRINITY_DN15699_c0_g1_i2:311-874(-)